MSTRVIFGAAVVGVAGLLVSAAGLVVDPQRLAFSYLTAVAYVLSLALGALMFTMIAHASAAKWFVVLHRVTETIAAILPAVAVLFVPLLFLVPELYPWARPLETLPEHLAHLVEFKRPYLNVPFFVIRAVIYFAIWIAIALLLQAWSLGKTPDNAVALLRRQRRLSAGGLWAMALTLTFAAFDWIMSLDPMWFSSAIGVYFFAGGFVGAIALVAVAIHVGRRSGVFSDVVSEGQMLSIGKLLFAFIVFWAYMAFFQFFIIWMADLPEEVPFYLERAAPGWQGVGIFLAVGHFAVPFAILLSRAIKKRSGAMAVIGAWVILVHYVDVYWLVMPFLNDALTVHWLDLTAVLGVGGVSVAYGVWRARGRDLVQPNDPFFEKAIHYSGT